MTSKVICLSARNNICESILSCQFSHLSTLCTLPVAAIRPCSVDASLDLFLASWICGTASDVFFMFMPKFCDNFWQAQVTIMLTPRLLTYCEYVRGADILFTHGITQIWFLIAYCRSNDDRAAGSYFTPYDLNGARFLWWTWHDTDAAIYERLGGAIGSTMWILTYTCVFNLVSLVS